MSNANKIVCVDEQKGVYETCIDEKKGIFLTFTRNETGKFVPSSTNEILQNWLLNETGKEGKIEPVKFKAMVHVAKAAEQRLKYPKAFEAKAKAKKAMKEAVSSELWERDPVSALQQYFQKSENRIMGQNKQPILPTYDTVDVIQGGGEQIVTIVLNLPDGSTRDASGRSAKEANAKAALEYAAEIGVFGKKENDVKAKNSRNEGVKTSAPRGYYQMGDVFSVDDRGMAHKLPKTEEQLFLGPDLWMGLVGSTSVICRHNEPVASFGWGKVHIAGNLLDAMERAHNRDEFTRIMRTGGGTMGEEQFRDALGREISKEQFFEIMEREFEKQDENARYALYRGKPGTPLEQARRCAFLRQATLEEFANTVEGFLEVYRLGDKIKEAERKTRGAHGGNRDMLEMKVLDLEEEALALDGKILDNKKLFRAPKKNKRDNDRQPDMNNPMTVAMMKAFKNGKGPK